MTKKVVALLVVFGVILGGYIAWTAHCRAAPATAADAYIHAMVVGDTGAAQDVSCGSAAWAIEKDATAARVVELRTQVNEIGSGYAEVLAYAELELADNTYDAGWYRLILHQSNDEWRVASFGEYEWAFGTSGRVSGNDKRDQTAVLDVYLDALVDGDYKQAAGFLCGPARRAHEQAEYNFKRLPMESISEPEIIPIWRRGNQAVCQAEYGLDGRQVKVLVRFAELTDGWRIAAVDQL